MRPTIPPIVAPIFTVRHLTQSRPLALNRAKVEKGGIVGNRSETLD